MRVGLIGRGRGVGGNMHPYIRCLLLNKMYAIRNLSSIMDDDEEEANGAGLQSLYISVPDLLSIVSYSKH